MSVSETRKVPVDACRFDASPMQFADGEPQDGKAPITILARSPQPIDHWYWGRIVHDMSGVKFKEKIPLDFCHNYWETIGYADKFDASAERGLVVSGETVSFQPDDKAAEVTFKGKRGVPYEASIDWSGSGARIEEIGEGVTVQVNGYAFTGPGYVVREWPLRAVAVCPHGADSNTKSQFSERDARNADREVFIFSAGDRLMSQKPSAAPAAPAPAAPAGATQHTETPAGGADHRAQFAAELKRFTDAFGGENGGKWFADGNTFEAALGLQNKLLSDKVADLEKALADEKAAHAELQTKFAGLKLGEESPVSSNPAEGGGAPAGDANKFGDNMPDGLARFAAQIKLPTTK